MKTMTGLLYILFTTTIAYAQSIDASVGGYIYLGSKDNPIKSILVRCVQYQEQNLQNCEKAVFYLKVARAEMPLSEMSHNASTAISMRAISSELYPWLKTTIAPRTKKARQFIDRITFALDSNLIQYAQGIEDAEQFRALEIVLKRWVETQLQKGNKTPGFSSSDSEFSDSTQLIREQGFLSNELSNGHSYVAAGVTMGQKQYGRFNGDLSIRNDDDEVSLGIKLSSDHKRQSAEASFSVMNGVVNGQTPGDAGVGMLFRVESGYFANHIGVGFLIETSGEFEEDAYFHVYISPLTWGRLVDGQNLIDYAIRDFKEEFRNNFRVNPGNAYMPQVGFRMRYKITKNVAVSSDLILNTISTGNDSRELKNTAWDDKNSTATGYNANHKQKINGYGTQTSADLEFAIHRGLGLKIGVMDGRRWLKVEDKINYNENQQITHTAYNDLKPNDPVITHTRATSVSKITEENRSLKNSIFLGRVQILYRF